VKDFLEEKMTKISKIILILGILIGIVGIVLVYLKNKQKPLDYEYNMKTSSIDKNSGKVLDVSPSISSKYLGTLQFKTKPNSKNMAQALLCVEQYKNVEKVDLYMPDMGHGSQPPTVNQASLPSNLQSQASEGIGFGCLSLENMQLFMSGLWQVRLFYKDGTVGLFDFQILE